MADTAKGDGSITPLQRQIKERLEAKRSLFLERGGRGGGRLKQRTAISEKNLFWRGKGIKKGCMEEVPHCYLNVKTMYLYRVNSS